MPKLDSVYQGKVVSSDGSKKTVEFQGIKIHLDRPKGLIMTGKDSKGEDWSREYKYDYGFIPKTLGGDGDGLDVFIGPDKDASETYWAVQNKDDGTFDEYKCILPGQELTGSIVGGSKSFYTGQAVKLRVASGKTLAVTPNHPVLTSRGLTSAGSLKKGDYLLAYDGEGELPGPGDYEQNPPTTVEKVFSSLVELHPLGVSRKLVSPLDFHGDAGGFQGEVEIVRTYRELRSDVVSQAAKRVQEGALVGSLPAEAGLVGGRALHASLHAESSPGVGAARPLIESPPVLGQGLRGPSGDAQAYRFGKSSDGDLALLKAASDRSDIDTQTFGDALRRLPSGVTLDQIIDIELVGHSGPVFDFESIPGLMVINQLVVSNCFLGFTSREAAIGAFRDHIPVKFLGGMVSMRLDMMKAMLGMHPNGYFMKTAMVQVSFTSELQKIAFERKVKQRLERSYGVDV